jgi:hypothetical protein
MFNFETVVAPDGSGAMTVEKFSSTRKFADINSDRLLTFRLVDL